MYIMIGNNGLVKKVLSITDNDLQMADDGLIDIIDISYPINHITYHGEEWNIIKIYLLSIISSFISIKF